MSDDIKAPFSLCFWCLSNDKMVATEKETGVRPKVTYDACPECQKIFDQGITIFEASHLPIFKNQHSIIDGLHVYPSQRYWVVNEDAVNSILEKPYATKAISGKRAFLESAAFRQLLSHRKPPGAATH